jgi:hypothetical protein
MGGLVNAPSFDGTFNLKTKTNTGANLVALIVAIYEIGCFIGAVSTSFFGEKLGRRKSIFIVRLDHPIIKSRSDGPGCCCHDYRRPASKYCLRIGSHVSVVTMQLRVKENATNSTITQL